MIRFVLAVCLHIIAARSFVIPPAIDALPQPSLHTSDSGSVHSEPSTQVADPTQPLPVVVWHGLGDAADADGMQEVAELIAQVNPGTYVHLIALGEGNDDRSQSWFGDLNDQVDLVCQQLAADPILSTAPAINAIGFSQGGQFLRGYIERCTHWAPKVNTLITFGSQHNGIADFYKCNGWTDFLCNSANLLLKSSLIWSDYLQQKVVPAQYYRPTEDYDNYLEHSNFLADINNERAEKNQTYADNLSQLEKFVMIVFDDDTVVHPKESGWFTNYDKTTNVTSPLRERKIYKEDWIGLKKLDEKGALVFDHVKGGHMQLNTKDLVRLFSTYLGPATLAEHQDLELHLELK